MSKNTKLLVTGVIIAASLVLTAIVYEVIDYGFKKIVIEKVDYNKLKLVEDTCRSMVASYESDKLVYEQYKDSNKAEEKSWAEQAKMRANKTASSYNNYVLENSYIWSHNVPADIQNRLAYIK